jgi:cyclophilin family peptidyl-prolyl cis-trans isomerase
MLECGVRFHRVSARHMVKGSDPHPSDQEWLLGETGDRGRRKNKHAVDALASSAEEGRGQLRKASGRCRPT